MVRKTLIKAGIKRHKEILIGIFVLLLLVSISLGTVITVWSNSTSYLRDELSRARFGTLTAWVSDNADTNELIADIEALENVELVEIQNLIFSNYTINGQESDSEGQLIPYSTTENRYRFFTDNLSQYQTSTPMIAPGEVYVSPSLVSMFGVELGDTISFPIARNGGSIALTIKGFYEDPFMGSSMIGMKSFLISAHDSNIIMQTIQSANIDALARIGAMLHIFSTETSITAAQLNVDINQNTDLPRYVEFVHSADAISGFMLILQNAFSGILIAFVLVLVLVVFIALGHSISGNIEADTVNMGILKAIGLTSAALRQIQLAQYAIAILPSMLLGIAFTGPASEVIARATLTTTGMLIPSNIPWSFCLGAFAIVLGILCSFIIAKTAKIRNITPLHAIRGEMLKEATMSKTALKIRGEQLNLSLALRQLIAGKTRYLNACFVAILLVFFSCTVGRMDAWLGADGKGMMDAFNPADHDIGVQMLGKHTLNDAQDIARRYTDITDSYQLAMVNASVNGIDYTANVISQPERFHILEGQTSMRDNEIVVTEFVAMDLGVVIGDEVTIMGESGSMIYSVSGIYSCANDMGGNIGMSREGYLRIAQDNSQIWCDHYFLADTSQKATITAALTAEFGGAVHVHENTWPGLKGIILAMQSMVVFMAFMVALFVFIITIMTASKIIAAEKKDLGIYKAIGFTNQKLQISFALRFGIIALIGSTIGVILSEILTDLLVSSVMKMVGISNFASNPNIFILALPAIFVTLLFLVFAYLAAGKIKSTDLTILITK